MVRTFHAWFHSPATIVGLCAARCCICLTEEAEMRWDERHSLAWNLHTNATAAQESRNGVRTMILKSRMFFKVVRFFSAKACFVSLHKQLMMKKNWFVFVFSTRKLVSNANLTRSMKRYYVSKCNPSPQGKAAGDMSR